MKPQRIDLVAFDADDTLWHSEDWFTAAEARFVELIEPYAPTGVAVAAALTATERANMAAFGYGVRAFTLSCVEAAITLSEGRVPTEVLAGFVQACKAHLVEPVRLLPGAAAALAAVSERHRAVLITKGDLLHQTHKVTTSGLDHHFDAVEVVLEKDASTYRRLLRHFDVAPEHFVMVGNSLRSDILPVLSIGGFGVHVPYPLLWELEHVDDTTDGAHLMDHVVELPSLIELPSLLATWHAVD